MIYGWILVPIISAFIGWFTNRIALQMLFHPQEPKKVLGFTLQGFFPKKQQQFAEKLGKLVNAELLTFRDIEEKITHPGNVQKMMPLIDEHIDHFLRVKLPAQMPMIGMLIGERTIAELKTVFTAELETIFPLIIKKYMHNLEHDLDLEKMIVEKLSRFSSAKLEQILYANMLKEFRFVGFTGAVLGFVIGLFQVLLLSLLH